MKLSTFILIFGYCNWQIIGRVILLLTIALAFTAAAQTNTPPTPVEMGLTPPAVPTNAPPCIVLPASAEWELTFEWVPEVGSTNITTYPIFIQVPFEHDNGFVFVRARKVGASRSSPRSKGYLR